MSSVLMLDRHAFFPFRELFAALPIAAGCSLARAAASGEREGSWREAGKLLGFLAFVGLGYLERAGVLPGGVPELWDRLYEASFSGSHENEGLFQKKHGNEGNTQ